MAGLDDAGHAFDIEVDQVAGQRVFIALYHRCGVEIADAVQLKFAQDAADRRATETCRLSDAIAGPALAIHTGCRCIPQYGNDVSYSSAGL